MYILVGVRLPHFMEPPADFTDPERGMCERLEGYVERMETGEVGRTPEQFFRGSGNGLSVFHAVEQAVHDFGNVSIKVSKSQIAFRRRRGFAYLWRPDQYLRSDVPVVLSVALPYEAASPRFKQVAHPSRNVWMHHLELHQPDEIDREVQAWLAEAFENAR